MWRHLLAGATIALVTMAASASQNDEGRIHDQTIPVRDHRLEVLTDKLKLTDLQTVEVDAILQRFDKKVEAREDQLWKLQLQERVAMLDILTEEQRARLPDAMRAEREKEIATIAAKLGLTEEGQQRIQKVYGDFEQRFRQLVDESNQKDLQGQINKLSQEAFAAISKELTPEQRARLPVVLKEESREWHDPAGLREHIEAIASRLDLGTDQSDQVQRILTDYELRIAEPRDQLKQLQREKWAAIEHVLTSEQKIRLQEMLKASGTR